MQYHNVLMVNWRECHDLLKQGVEMILKTGTLDYNKSIFG